MDNEESVPVQQEEEPRKTADWQDHAVNIRVSLPFFDRGLYLTIVAGRERRPTDRRTKERTRYPLRTAANIFFVIGIATLFYAIALIALALNSRIIAF